MEPLQRRQELSVYGWIRQNSKKAIPTVITQLVLDFVTLSLPTKILNEDEQMKFLHVLYERLKQQSVHRNVNHMAIKLLYRASEHQYQSSKFHELCTDIESTLLIARSNDNKVYGGYASVSWNVQKQIQSDPNCFLFSIRPSLHVIEMHPDLQEEGAHAVWSHLSYGPTFGAGNDIWICDRCDIADNSGINPTSFDFSGSGINERSHLIDEYEVFALELVSQSQS